MGNSYQACISTAGSKQMILPFFPQHFSSMINKFKVVSRLSQAAFHYLWVCTPGSYHAFIVSTCECLSSYLQLTQMEQHLLQAMARLRKNPGPGSPRIWLQSEASLPKRTGILLRVIRIGCTGSGGRQADSSSSPHCFFLGQSWSSEKQKVTALTKHCEKPEPKRNRAMFPWNERILVFWQFKYCILLTNCQ